MRPPLNKRQKGARKENDCNCVGHGVVSTRQINELEWELVGTQRPVGGFFSWFFFNSSRCRKGDILPYIYFI